MKGIHCQSLTMLSLFFLGYKEKRIAWQMYPHYMSKCGKRTSIHTLVVVSICSYLSILNYHIGNSLKSWFIKKKIVIFTIKQFQKKGKIVPPQKLGKSLFPQGVIKWLIASENEILHLPSFPLSLHPPFLHPSLIFFLSSPLPLPVFLS